MFAIVSLLKRPIVVSVLQTVKSRSLSNIKAAKTVTVPLIIRRRVLSLVAYNNNNDGQEEDEMKHCPTCSCPLHHHGDDVPLPPPLPEPEYSVLRRVLPSHLIALGSTRGRQLLKEVLSRGTAESYWSLLEHFQNQSDPAFCGLTTMVMVLNSMSIDPQVRWRGGWRYYGDEEVLLSRCCLSAERIRRVGITMEEFQQLAYCQGLTSVTMKRPSNNNNASLCTLDDFRRDVIISQSTPLSSFSSSPKLVVSFSRAALGQTGDGHFSPIAAYHEETDSVLIVDVARFKYPPYWTTVQDIYQAMIPIDKVSNQSRGWFVLQPPPPFSSSTKTSLSKLAKKAFVHDGRIIDEFRLPAKIVPQLGQPDICPMGKVKVEYCRSNHNKTKDSHRRLDAQIKKSKRGHGTQPSRVA